MDRNFHPGSFGELMSRGRWAYLVQMERHDQRQNQLFTIMPKNNWERKLEAPSSSPRAREAGTREGKKKNCGWSAEYKRSYGDRVDRQAQFVFASNIASTASPHLRPFECMSWGGSVVDLHLVTLWKYISQVELEIICWKSWNKLRGLRSSQETSQLNAICLWL